MAMSAEEEKELRRKFEILCEYCERTGDWELVRDISELLEEATQALRGGKERKFLEKWEKRNAERAAKLTAKKATRARKAGRA
jgi:hypothetical protein